MTTYQEAWSPESLEEAMFSVDPAHEGETFWRVGQGIARMLANRYLPEQAAESLTVLEYGCGLGRVLRAMPGRYRIGVDVSAQMLALASEQSPELEFRLCNGQSIPAADASVDVLYSILTFQHMDAVDTAAVVLDVGRVLRPGGRCWLQFGGFGQEWAPDAVIDKRGVCHWTGEYATSSHPALLTIAYTPEAIRAMCEAAGLRELGFEERAHAPGKPNWAFWGER